LMAEMKAKLAAEEQREELKAACHWADDSLIETLSAGGVTSESLLALSLVPLVRVAWADGTMDTKERDAILKAAADKDCQEGSVAYQLLESWLHIAPPDGLFQAWKEYAAGLVATLDADVKADLQQRMVGHAENVAKAAGGFLGLAAISAKEQAVLDQIKAAYAGGTPPDIHVMHRHRKLRVEPDLTLELLAKARPIGSDSFYPFSRIRTGLQGCVKL